MTSIIHDYADIASRMKGELKKQPKPEITRDTYALACITCCGRGLIGLPGLPCGRCYGWGIEP